MLLSFGSWWHSLPSFEKILWTIALVFSFMLLLQVILSMIHGDHDHASGHSDGHGDHDHGVGYQFFTLKNMMAFFTMFGWVGIGAVREGIGYGTAACIAFASGVIIVVIMAVIFKKVSELRYNGVMQIENAINKTGSTYLFIPAKRSGMGKVHIKIQGTLQELFAMTDDETEIATGTLVRVKSIINERILLVTLAENRFNL
jgi:hypothetical protein